MTDFILHHYDPSPFSEKARLAFGAKGLAWRSVITPNIAPKPDLTPLTGGYRRAPVMQIGADVFCDSQVVLAEIERRAPSPPMAGPLDEAINFWGDRAWFALTVPIVFAEIGEHVPPAFIADREKLSGRPFDIAAMRAAAIPARGQWRAMAGWVDSALEGRPFLGGGAAGLADISAFMNVWFLGGATPHLLAPLTAGFDRLAAWRERMTAIGHGQRSELSGPEALAIAAAAEPVATERHDPADPCGLSPGAAVAVAADDYGRDPIVGTLVAANRERVVVERHHERLGRLHVHFPRTGYGLAPA